MGLDGKGLQLFNCAGFLLVNSRDLLLLAFVCELGFVVKPPWAWLFLQNDYFYHGWYSWVFINLVREVFLEGCKTSVKIQSPSGWYSWHIFLVLHIPNYKMQMNSFIFPMSVGFCICKTKVSKWYLHFVNMCQNSIWGLSISNCFCQK